MGTLPPPRFCERKFKPEDVDFCYGSKDNQLWPVLDKIFNLNLSYTNHKESVKERIDFLNKYKIGFCDIVESCQRSKIDASDLGMTNIKLRNIIYYLSKNKNINKIIFTGKNSKNGPEYFFRKLLKEANIEIIEVLNNSIREHYIIFENRKINLFSLTSPSNAANRSIGANKIYKEKKQLNKDYSTFDFRYDEYKIAFK